MKKRIFIGGFKQESNSFNPIFSDFEVFRAGYLEGDALLNAGPQAGQTLLAFLDVLRSHDIETIGGVEMSAASGGPVRHSVAERFLDRTLELLHDAGPIDGILLNLHGATLSECSDDVCGDILEAIRGDIGETLPIAAACDLHANITERMLRSADIICGYQTYPHVDFYETGKRTAELLLKKLDGQTVRTAAAFIPMMAPASGYVTGAGELKDLMEYAHGLVRDGKILDFSVFQVQPWLDIPNISSCVIAAAGSEEAARAAADELARRNFMLRDDLQCRDLRSMEEVVRTALKCPEDETVILVDSADSAGAGSCSDSAAPLEYILPYRTVLRSAVSVTDPEAVLQAFRLGVGGKGDFLLGGKLAPELSHPVPVRDAEVKSLHNGWFVQQGPANRGRKIFLGKTAVLQADEVSILISSLHASQRDIQFFRGFGIEPSVCRLICIKANTSFKAGYTSVNARIYNTATPGSAGAVLQDLPYKRLPKPMYPFQEISRSDIRSAACYR